MITDYVPRKNIAKAIRLVTLRRRAAQDTETGSYDAHAGGQSKTTTTTTSPDQTNPETGESFELTNSESLFEMDSAVFSAPPAKQSRKISILVGLFVAVGGFVFGYDTGLINNISEMPYVNQTFAPNGDHFTTPQIAILVSFLSLGTFIGALLAPSISDTYGRKTAIIFSSLFVFMIGNSLQVASRSLVLLVVGRVISGLSVGLISAAVPLYQSEAAQKSVRGAIITTYQWAITWGLLAASAVSQGTYKRMNGSSYQIPIGLQYIWASLLGVGIIFLPESPRYYVLKDRLNEAAKSLSFLRGVPENDSGLLEELVEIKATYDYEMSFGKLSYLDCFRSSKSRSKQRLRMLTGIALQGFQQLSGINFIFYYGVDFFQRTGVGESYLVSLITYAVNVIFNIPGLFLVEFIGRRKLLLGGGIIMTLSNFIIAIVGCFTESVFANKVMIAFICLFIASFSATWGGCVWVISAELYPLGVRAKCNAICAASNWLMNFICALITPYIVHMGNTPGSSSSMGTKIFFVWGSLNAAAVVVVFFAVYETSGLSLEEIDELYKNSTSGIQSMKWNAKIRNSPDLFNKARHYHDSNQDSIELDRQLEDEQIISHDYTTNRNAPPIENSEEKYGPQSQFPSFGVRNTSLSADTQDLSQGAFPNPKFVDIGNGLAINTYQRGPPSVLSDSSEDEEMGMANAAMDRDSVSGSGDGGTSHSESGPWSSQSNPEQPINYLNLYMAHLKNRDFDEQATSCTDYKGTTVPSEIMNKWKFSAGERPARSDFSDSTEGSQISEISSESLHPEASTDATHN